MQRVPYSKLALLEEEHKVFSKFCKAAMQVGLPKVLRRRSFFKRNVFMSQSSRCGWHKFIAFKTTSQSPRCTDWFA